MYMYMSVHVCWCICLLYMSMYVCSVTQSWLTLFKPMDHSPLGSSLHGIFQARILEPVAISYSTVSFRPGIEPVSLVSPALTGGFLTTAAPGKPTCGHTHVCIGTSVHREIRPGTSLVVQWLRLCTRNAGAWVQFLVRGVDHTYRNWKIQHAAMKTEDSICQK